jgi:hypothetical protein
MSYFEPSPAVQLTVGALCAPNPPFVEISAGVTNIGLRWPDVPGATSYNVYRSTTSGAPVLLTAGASRTALIYLDATALAAVDYYYTVTSVGPGGESGFSTELSARRRTNTVALNGGLTWTGWQYRGKSIDLYRFLSGTLADIYDIYTTIFVCDSAVNVLTGSPTQAGAPAPVGLAAGVFSPGFWTTGNLILGIGIKRISGSAIFGSSKFVEFSFFPDDASLRPASTVGGADGRRTFGVYDHTGDISCAFKTGSTASGDTITVDEGQGTFWGGPYTPRMLPSGVGSGTSSDFCFRQFGQVASDAYMQLYDLTAMEKNYGPTALHPGFGYTQYGIKVSPGGPVAVTTGMGSDLGGFAVTNPVRDRILISPTAMGFGTFSFIWAVK